MSAPPSAATADIPLKHSVLRRFSSTLLANLIGAGASFVASILLARGLGSARYGDFSFLLASFAALQTGLDVGSSTAYYTFLSKGRGGLPHVRGYALWLAARFTAVLLVLGLLFPQPWLQKIWFHPRPLIVLAFIGFFFSVPLRTFLIQTAESVRETVFVQTAMSVLSLIHVGAVAALFATGVLSVPAMFWLLAAEYALLALFVAAKLDWSLFGSSGRVTLREYAAFCAPLVAYSWLGFICEFADRWLLQRFGGSAQQGFFSISFQFSAVALIATTSLLNIFWKEIADAHGRGDFTRMRELYRTASRALFFVAAAAACFLAPHSHTILTLLAGPAYESGWLAFAVMLSYPVFQTIGQLNGALFFATEDTRTHVVITSGALLVGLPLTYLLLAPANAWIPGLGLGAVGLATRWSVVQVAAVGIQCWAIARKQGIPTEMPHHLALFAGLLLASAATRFGVESITGWNGPAALIASAPIYGALVAAFAAAYPEQLGASRQRFQSLISRAN